MLLLKWSLFCFALVAGQTFPGFVPEVTNPLSIEYKLNATSSEFVSPDGKLINMSVVASPPIIGIPLSFNLTPSPNGFLFLMVDPDALRPNAVNITTTFHYMLGNLTLPSTQPIPPVPDNANIIVPPIMEVNFTEFIIPANQSPIADYLSPTPLPDQKHRYTFLLFEQPDNFVTNCSAPSWNCIPPDFQRFLPNVVPGSGATGRLGFNVSLFMQEAGLREPVAGLFMEVESSPNSSIPTTNGTQLNVPNATSTSTATGGGTTTTPTKTSSFSSAATTIAIIGEGSVPRCLNWFMWAVLGMLGVLLVF